MIVTNMVCTEQEWREADDATKDRLAALISEAATANPAVIRCRKAGAPPHGLWAAPDVKARALGHIYSAAGERELGTTGWCEYCFDKVFANVEDE